MASTISAARVALYDLLAAADGLAGVQVTFGSPGAYQEQEVVALMGVESPDEDDAVIAGGGSSVRTRDEFFTLVVTIKAHDPAADDAQSVDARCWAMADVVRTTVYANRTLSDTLTTGWARVESQTGDGAQPAQGAQPDTVQGWVCFVEVRVACRARVA